MLTKENSEKNCLLHVIVNQSLDVTEQGCIVVTNAAMRDLCSTNEQVGATQLKSEKYIFAFYVKMQCLNSLIAVAF